MTPPKILLASALCLASGLASSFAAAAPALSAENRYGANFNEWFVRGDAVVSASTVFSQGVRLAAWDGQNENDLSRVAVATAVYFFQIPPEAVSARIDVGYRADPPPLFANSANSPQAAGFLFVRNQSVERRVAPQGDAAAAPADEPGFAGDSYLLPANQAQQAVDIPVADRVANGVLELHLVAGAGQVLDVQYIQVSSFAAEAALAPVVPMPSVNYVPDPYQYTYFYYYTGPSYYPYGGFYAGFNCFDSAVDPFYWGGWPTWRACFHARHPWRHRPHDFEHGHPFAARPIVIADPYIDAHRRQWLRDHFHIDGQRLSDRDITAMARYRTHVVSDEQARLAHDHARTIAEQVRQSEQDLRTRYGSRFPDRLREWGRDRSGAQQELASSGNGQVIRNASAQWQALHADPRSRRLDATTPLPNLTQPPSNLPSNDWRRGGPWSPGYTGPKPPTPPLNFAPRTDGTKIPADSTPKSFLPLTPRTFPGTGRRFETPSNLPGTLPPPYGPPVKDRRNGDQPSTSFLPYADPKLPMPRITVGPWADVATPRTLPSTDRRLFTIPSEPFVPSTPQPPAGYPGIGRRYEGGAGTPSLTSPSTLPAIQPRTDVRTPYRGSMPQTFAPPTPQTSPTIDRRFTSQPFVPSVPQPPASYPGIGRQYNWGASPRTFTPQPPSTSPAFRPRTDVVPAPRTITTTPPPAFSLPRSEPTFTRRAEAPPTLRAIPAPSGTQPRIDTRSSTTGRNSPTIGADSPTRWSTDPTSSGRRGRR